MSVVMGEIYRNFPFAAHECRCGCGLILARAALIIPFVKLLALAPEGIEVTSGTRCTPWNAACGGHPCSGHLFGMAVDVRILGLDLRAQYTLACQVRSFRDGAIGVYLDWSGGPGLHLEPRRTRARWGYDDDGYYPGERGLLATLDRADKEGV